MALWPLAMGAASWVPPVVAGGPTSVAVVADSTAHTKGAWTELLAATAGAVQGFHLGIAAATATLNTDTATLLDIGIGGAGSEIVALADVQVGGMGNVGNGTWSVGSVWVPLALPAGARVAARAQSAVVSKSVAVMFTPAYGVPAAGGVVYGSAATYGVDAASSRGRSVTSGSSAEGSWVEITSATTRPARGLMVGCVQSATGGSRRLSVDIGVGGSGAEVAVVVDVPVELTSSEIMHLPFAGAIPLGVAVPEGSRLSVRSRSDGVIGAYFQLHAFC